MVANRQNQRVYAALDAVLPRLDPIEDKRDMMETTGWDGLDW